MKIDYYTSLWNYIYHDEPYSLEQVVRQVRAEGFGVELWPYFFTLDPYRPALQTRPDASEGAYCDLFDPTHIDRLRAAVLGVPTTWHSRGTGEKPLKVTTFEGHAQQIDMAVSIGSPMISVHDIGEAMTNTMVGDDLAMASRVMEYAEARGVLLALETGDFEACLKAVELLPALRICLDPAYINSNSDRSLSDYIDAFSDRICYLHLYDYNAEGGHYTPGTGEIPGEDWMLLLRWMRHAQFRGPVAFEIHPPPQKVGQTAVETVVEARDYMEDLAARL